MSDTEVEKKKSKAKKTQSGKPAHDSGETASEKTASAKKTPQLLELDENKLDAPSWQTIVMLSVICGSTLIMWAAGRAACNYHVPGESLTPRVVTLDARTRSAKDVGFEFAQAVSGGDFDLASKLARGEALAWVKEQKSACGGCEARVLLRADLQSVATVFQANSVDALVSVRTLAGQKNEEIRFLGIDRKARKWAVSRVATDMTGLKLKDTPTKNDAPSAIRRPKDAKISSEGASSH